MVIPGQAIIWHGYPLYCGYGVYEQKLESVVYIVVSDLCMTAYLLSIMFCFSDLENHDLLYVSSIQIQSVYDFG